MKKILVAFTALAICIIFTLCRKPARVSPGLEEFKQEDRLTQIVESIQRFSVLGPSDSLEIFAEYITFRQQVDYLLKKYGKQQAKTWAREMMRSTAANAKTQRALTGCCKLKANGTTDQSCCNFWESVVVAFETIDCGRPYPGAPPREIEEFYECIQAEVCENC